MAKKKVEPDGAQDQPKEDLPPVCDCVAMKGPHRHMHGGPVPVEQESKE